MISAEDQIEDDIVAAAQQLIIDVPDLAKGLGKSYEAWLYLRIAAGIKAPVIACDYQEKPTSTLIIRGGPGYIATSKSSNVDAAGFF